MNAHTLALPAGPIAELPALSGTARNLVIAASVVVLHVLVLWALQSGLLRRAVEVLVPAQVLAELIEPPAPQVLPPPPAPNKAPVAKAKTAPSLPPPPMPLAVPDTQPVAAAPVGVTAPPPPAPSLTAPTAPVAALAVAPAAPPAPPAPPRVELPSSNADYLQNPKPQYPGLSKRLGEQGQVIHSVLIGTDGLPVSAQLVKSSGFDRLDQAAYTAVMRWRYVPGKRNGVPTAMSFNVPINWVLE
ncbi:MAG: energy transducer TonB [Burkholderiales bacterium]|nr:energy transducer TonB [Burkholderiales bacterium]